MLLKEKMAAKGGFLNNFMSGKRIKSHLPDKKCKHWEMQTYNTVTRNL